ncbi:uncharacterized protein BJ212DRAFT_1383713 [Suillus subaureus]|uniref:Uncharacterized protein n=1 Tax=Suillus subaureus TaxID=48587 RepID=A0A9P7E0P4_9AGAM|nr:uncharacterized protein BJ212DRAFT_1383713 [Suillus subaureus]KAG1808167.1 hypothetical protein BJ212DRAFT_1383713 [Suillus subaureus]
MRIHPSTLLFSLYFQFTFFYHFTMTSSHNLQDTSFVSLLVIVTALTLCLCPLSFLSPFYLEHVSHPSYPLRYLRSTVTVRTSLNQKYSPSVSESIISARIQVWFSTSIRLIFVSISPFELASHTKFFL